MACENVTSSFITAMVDIQNKDYATLLEMENANRAKALAPVIVYLVILMIIGVIGNALVLYVYKYQYNRKSSTRIFILCLAILDMITCLLGMPYHLMDMLYSYMFVWNAACRIMSFSLTFTILSSIFILNLIAIDRYRKICKPFEKQLSGIFSKILSYVMVFMALICAIPMLFMYGSANIATRITNLTGTICHLSDDYIRTDVSMIYRGFIFFLIFIVSVGVFIGIYTKVGITVWKRRKFTESSLESKQSVSSQSTTSISGKHFNVRAGEVQIEHADDETAYFKEFKADSMSHVLESNACVVSKEDDSPYTLTLSGVKKENKRLRIVSELAVGKCELSVSKPGFFLTRHPKSHIDTKKQKRTLRITIMFFIVTVIFIVSFLPYLVISIVDGIDAEFWNRMTTGEIVLLNLLMRTYLINNMINPIIYWFMDHKFKEEVTRFFREIKMCHRGTVCFHDNQKDFHS